MKNRLAAEASPYLAQHGENPVDWYPWGPEALSRAREEERPILLSIGYSACHWCHVMERESFEDPLTAALMNRSFVNVKVDREERPDLDQVYQTCVQIMGQGGGWPLTVFLTPERRPFYAGTYFPPVERHGRPAFSTVLTAVADAFANKRSQIEESASEITRVIAEATASPRPLGDVPEDLLEAAARALSGRIDERHGGFGTRPKFPNSLALDVLLAAHHARGDEDALRAVEKALDAMRDGGVYDQLGWGFHRYSTDERWLVPHFEKMLYDNALLARTYLDAHLATGSAAYAATVREVLAYVTREMRADTGGFFATEDADSEGEEGRFFVWTPREVDEAVGPVLAEAAKLRWGITEGGNFDGGRTVLAVHRPVEDVARALGRPVDRVANEIEEARLALFAFRETRVRPFRDEKIIASWNGLMVSAFARAGAALDEASFVDVATDGLAFVKRGLFVDGVLHRVLMDGRARIPGFVEDHGAVAMAAIDVHQATFDAGALDFATEVADVAIARFWDAEGGAFHFAEAADDLVVRAHDVYDDAVPSGTSLMTHALLRLAVLGGDPRYQDIAERALSGIADAARKNPFGFGHAISAMDFLRRGATTVVVVGTSSDPGAHALIAAARRGYAPHRLIALVDPDAPALDAAVSGLVGARRAVGGRATAYVCRDSTCGPPIVDSLALSAALASRSMR